MATPSNSPLAPRAVLAALALATLAALSPRRAEAAPRPSPVTWTALSTPPGERRPALEKTLRAMLEREASGADWGRAARGGVEASFELLRLEHAVERGVLRVHCAAAGRLSDGRPARSTFTLGGRPAERASLERRVLTLAVRGVVVRLAELARAAARPRVRVANEPGEF
ncbi:MAG TPA: hypothetical protein VFS00_08100 [Polyangiaceae bacterium]|nr:hypothetical protein [Polyangiaceae bacterium]